MRLLIVTQNVDQEDPVMGFFHQWLLVFGSQCEHVTVIGHMVGAYDLPKNIDVHSLGKEHGGSRWVHILRFWSLQWKLRKEYDAVLVHMTPIWIILGAPLWILTRTPMHLWYEVRRGGKVLRLALVCVRHVFCATEFGIPWSHPKQVVVGHGIDTNTWTIGDSTKRDKHLIIAVGRITGSKNYLDVINAFAHLPSEYRLRIIGTTVRPDDEEELYRLKIRMRELNVEDRIEIGSLTHEETKGMMQTAQLMLHACIGGLDKVVLEAMTCGCPVVSSSVAAHSVLPEQLQALPDTMTSSALSILSLDADQRSALEHELHAIVERDHNLQKLIEKLITAMSH